MIAQYQALKAEHPDCLLFFRLGDFYELFFEDAKLAAPALDIALTRRGRHGEADIPMCGVPVHSAEGYLERLIKQGFKVAICEQTEDPGRGQAPRRQGAGRARRGARGHAGHAHRGQPARCPGAQFPRRARAQPERAGARLAGRLDRRLPDRPGRRRHLAGRARADRARASCWRPKACSRTSAWPRCGRTGASA